MFHQSAAASKTDTTAGDQDEGAEDSVEVDVERYTLDEMHEVLYEYDMDRKAFTSIDDIRLPPMGSRYKWDEIPARFLV